jgi:hypothetical protein
MLGSTEALGVAALVLVLVASLPAARGGARWGGIVAWFAVLLAAALVMARGADALGYRVAAQTSEVRKYASAALNGATEQNVLIIEGASYVEGGVDVKVLRKELEALGYSVRPVRIALGGANHFERYRLFQDVVASLGSEPQPGQRWIFLAEIHSTYDSNPLEQFERNHDTARAYHYLTASNAFQAALAAHGSGVKPTDSATDWMLFRHALVNTFNVGLAQRLVPEQEIRAANGRVGNRKARFAFDADQLLNEAKNPGPPGAVAPWVFGVREARARALWGRYGVEWVYFGVPGTRVGQLRYIRRICAATSAPCISPDPALIEALGTPSHWRNAGHLSGKGALVYSAWLAHELDRQGLLQR